MKKLFACLAVVLATIGVAIAQNNKPRYHQTATFKVGGDGFWDYLTYDPVGHRLFIAHNDKFEVIDATSGKKLGEIPASGAHGVALVQAKHLGYGTNGRAGTVTVFDLKTLQPVTEIKAGENPDAIIYDPYSRHVIVMNGRSRELMAIDPNTQKVVATIPLGGKLEFAAAAPGHVYVNVEDQGEIASVDTKTWKAGPRWKLEGCKDPSGLAIDGKIGHLFSACGNKVMVVVDSKTGKQLATIPTGAGTDADRFDPETQLAFVSNGEGTITVVSTKNGKYDVVENIKTQRGARTMELNPKTHQLYTATAEFGPPAEGQRRPTIKPGTFEVLVYSPTK